MTSQPISTSFRINSTTQQDDDTAIPFNYSLLSYLQAHLLSTPSSRYGYIFWFFIPAVLVFWTCFFQINRFIVLKLKNNSNLPVKSTVLTWFLYPFRWLQSFHIRRLIPSSKTPCWYSSTLNVGQAIGVLVFTTILLLVTLVGDDYISPITCTWGGQCPAQVLKQSPPLPTSAPLRARHLESFQTPLPVNHLRQLISRRNNFLAPRTTTHSPNSDDWTSFTKSLVAPGTNVPRNLWTISSRFGLVAYAMIPFVISIALKSWPFNLFATPWLTHYGFDRASVIHRWTGRLIWIWSTIHTITFMVQLGHDSNPYGHAVLTDVSKYYRFKWGFVAYIALTIIIAFSFNPLRNRHYEFFYLSHVLLSIVFLVGCIVHSKPLRVWAISGLILWGSERAVRLVDWLWLNGFFNYPAHFWSNRLPPLDSTTKNGPANKGYHTSLSLPTVPNKAETLQNQNHGSPSLARVPKCSIIHFDPSNFSLPFSKSLPFEIPQGYALVQILPGHTLRLTLRMAKEVSWMVGQYLLLCVPSIHWWQTHPFTIGSSSSLSKWNYKNQSTAGKELVLLLRARSGFTKTFYQLVVQKRAQESQNIQGFCRGNGTLVRCQISRPLGSSGRIAWCRFDSVFIVCGGSGISFGLALLEEVCFKMYQKASDQKNLRWKASKVRLIWIFREYAHLCWVALALKKCLSMVSCGQIQLDLFVSNSRKINEPQNVVDCPYQHEKNTPQDARKSKDFFTPLEPPRLQDFSALLKQIPESEALQSRTEEENAVSITESAYETSSTLDTMEAHPPDVQLQLTEFEGEKQESTAFEVLVSNSVELEGKRRRSITLRRQKTRSSTVGSSICSEDKDEVQVSVQIESQKPEFAENIEKDDANMEEGSTHGVEIPLETEEKQALAELSEYVRTERPDLERLLEEEIEGSLGSTMVACCGPDSLNSYMRTLVRTRP
ncbi:hypothetical protein O181_035306 [Austropuccinia psidii MF-1]|uniref:FAD-binding FR-type domain-containing protein n=1 Tax=Austropuccinia psidii MF-1 TaxID=1389203 RepID=A0A9Q3D810_9BASI|nr:hypothetical protein [Austropuccinia psidii MF-1]